MTRAFIACCLLAPLFAYAAACNPSITQLQAIRIGKTQLAKERGSKAVRYFGPYTVKLVDCAWRVVGATPHGDVGGDIVISVSATTGEAHVLPQMRTDPRKIGTLRHERH